MILPKSTLSTLYHQTQKAAQATQQTTVCLEGDSNPISVSSQVHTHVCTTTASLGGVMTSPHGETAGAKQVEPISAPCTSNHSCTTTPLNQHSCIYNSTLVNNLAKVLPSSLLKQFDQLRVAHGSCMPYASASVHKKILRVEYFSCFRLN